MRSNSGILVSTIEIDAGAATQWGGLAGQLSCEERARAQRFAYDADRQAYIVAHCLKRRMLSRADPTIAPAEWRFDPGPYGKPAVRGRTDLHFNLSHCRGLVACAVRREGPIGIDVEWLGRPAPLEIVGRFFSRSETAWLLALAETARHEAFFRIWTLKEAYIKAVGLGLSQRLGDFSVSVQRLDIEFARPEMGDAAGWWFHQQGIGQAHILATAWEGEPPRDTLVVSREGLC